MVIGKIERGCFPVTVWQRLGRGKVHGTWHQD